MREVGRLDGLRILELGCGDGPFARSCVEAGCASYVGIDGASAMLKRAVANASDCCHFEVANIKDFEMTEGGLDMVVSRMGLHYVRDLSPVLARVHRALVKQGRFIFSVVHP